MARELDDAHPDAARQRARDRHSAAEDARRHRRGARLPTRRCWRIATHWFVRETIGFLRRTLRGSMSRRAASSPSSTRARALPARCSSWRSPPTAATCSSGEAARRAALALSAANFGRLADGQWPTRLATRFNGEAAPVAAIAEHSARAARRRATRVELGLVTFAPDELDWEDEIRLAIEERASLSPDALTGMEANLRFAGAETVATKIFGRLSAWQNWIFNRPNATGEQGALKLLRQRRAGRGSTGSAIIERGSDGDRLSRAHSEQRRSRRATGRCSARSSIGSRASSTGGARWGRAIPRGRCLSAHRHLGRRQGLGELWHVARCRITAGDFPRRRRCPTGASALATSSASRSGSRCRASTARRCAA